MIHLPVDRLPSATTRTTSRRKASTRIAVVLVGLLSLAAVPVAVSQEGASDVTRLGVEILSQRPHDTTAFTQGLLWHDGALYESTGQYGESTLRRVDPETGSVERLHSLPAEHFGEGLARVGERLIQLTWNAGVAYVYDIDDFELLERLRYDGKGWGLCFDGESLYMSDGTPRLTRRDPDSLAPLETLDVTLRGQPVAEINELECAEGWIYANVWQTDWVLRIDPSSGEVVALIDASPLRARLPATGDPDAVLNGIAYIPESATFLLTGKNWPNTFEVIFVE